MGESYPNYVELPNDPSLDFTTSLAFSIEFWTKVDNDFDDMVFINKGGGAGEEQYSFDIFGADLRFYVQSTEGFAVLSAPRITTSEGWVHIAGVFDAAEGIFKLYKNGAEVASTDPPSNLITTPNALVFGMQAPPFYNSRLQGQLDEVRFWNRSLCGAEILFNKDTELFDPTQQLGLVAYYNFNQGYANTSNFGLTRLTDLSGQDNEGTLFNFKLFDNTSNWTAPGFAGNGTQASAVFTDPIQFGQDPLPDATDECGVTLTPPTASNTCNASITATTNDPMTYDEQGSFMVTWMYDDGNGNTATQMQTVVIDDVTPPEFICQDDLSVTIDEGSCMATVTWNILEDLQPSDNCEISSATVDLGLGGEPLDIEDPTNPIFSSGIYPIGTSTVTYMLGDDGGNIAMCVFDIIVSDNVMPTAVCQDITVQLDEDGSASLMPSDINSESSDACSDITLDIIAGQTSYTCEDLGLSFMLTLEVADSYDNKSTCMAMVIIADDVHPCNTAPIADCVDLNVSADDNCQVLATAADFNDNSTDPDGDDLIFEVTPEGPYPLGETDVLLTVSDLSGASSQCTAKITVLDTTAPEPDVASLPTITSACSAEVEAPTATDNCEGAIIGTTSDPTSYTDQGSFTITWTYDDGNGNSMTQTQSVIIDDTTAPEPDVASLPTITSACSAEVEAPTATDNCEGAIIGTTSDPTSYTDQGSYTITWTYDDGNGNSMTQTQSVIIDDQGAPIPDVLVLPVITTTCEYSASAPTAVDNCSGIITATTTDLTYFSSIGSYIITWTYDDGNDNTTTQVQEVDIVGGATPIPNIANLPTITTECSATLTAPTASNECNNSIDGVTSDPLSYDEQGSYVVEWTYNDGFGNSSTQMQTVIIDDTTAPVPGESQLPTQTCSAVIDPPTAMDNCVGKIEGTTTDPTEFDVDGTYTITWTYDDGNGNSVSQVQTVVVNNVLTISCVELSQASSANGADGIGGVTISGGSGPYSLQVFDGNINVTYLGSITEGENILDNLNTGTYVITVRDGFGCRRECTLSISLPELCPSPMNPSALVISGNVARIDWMNTVTVDKHKVRYRILNSGDAWSELVSNSVNSYLFMNQLEPNTTYQYSVKSACPGSTLFTQWVNGGTFTTSTDNCNYPQSSSVIAITSSSATVNWTSFPDDLKYKLKYKKGGEQDWVQVQSTITSKVLSGLLANKKYKYKLKTKCALGWTNWSPKDEFYTTAPALQDADNIKPSAIIGSTIAIFPNPFKGDTNLNYQSSIEGEVAIRIHNVVGEIVYEQYSHSLKGQNNFNLPIEHLKKGAYIVQLIDSTKEIYTSKLVKYE